MTNKKINYTKKVLSLIPEKQEMAITGERLRNLTGLTNRALKKIISDLRKEYPICSRETNGGGYWMAENDMDIREFINMIIRRRNGYNNTIEIMKNHIDIIGER